MGQTHRTFTERSQRVAHPRSSWPDHPGSRASGRRLLLHPLRGRSPQRALAGRLHPLAASPMATGVEILNFLDDHSRLLARLRRLRHHHRPSDVVEQPLQPPPKLYGSPASPPHRQRRCLQWQVPQGQGAPRVRTASASASSPNTPRRITRRPAARSNASIRPTSSFLSRQAGAGTRPSPVLQAPARQLPRLLQPAPAPPRPRRPTPRCTPSTPASRPHPVAAPPPDAHFRVRHDRVDKTGRITLRYLSRLRHIGIGRAHMPASASTLLVANNACPRSSPRTAPCSVELHPRPTPATTSP